MPVKIGADCYDCLENMVRDAARIACTGNQARVSDVKYSALRMLKDRFRTATTAPALAADLLRRIRAESGSADPYAHQKQHECLRAPEQLDKLRPRFDDSLLSAVILAALGNSMDFFKRAEEAMAEIQAADPSRFRFHQNDVDMLAEMLEKEPLTVVYLTDNAGELFFDMPLIRHLRSMGHRVVLAPKGGPALNDLTVADLSLFYADEDLPEIVDTGCDTPGQDLENSSPAFLQLMSDSDLVVSKGMANFETIYPYSGTAHVFYILKIKCSRIAKFFDRPLNSYQAILDRIRPV